jgi:hypothetical protein
LRGQNAENDSLPGLAGQQAVRARITSSQPLMRYIDEAPHQPFLVGVRRNSPDMPADLGVGRHLQAVSYGHGKVV